uniref:Spaetzle domain-containing protein n=2 Tax=Clastoptera arizonana TaxID=38151 RepID=A0A1B6CY99_9HEMI
MWDYFPLLTQNLHETEYEEPSEVTERDVHHQHYRPLCQVMKRRVELRDDAFEYRPPHYIETVCKIPNTSPGEILSNSNNMMCAYPGFSCVQRSQTIYLTRRRFDSNCWESFTQTIASNCECMWPVLSLGEISHHY